MKYLIILFLITSCAVPRFGNNKLLVIEDGKRVLTAEHIGDAMCCKRESLWNISDLSDRLVPESLMPILLENGALTAEIYKHSSITIEVKNGDVKTVERLLKLTAKNLGK